mmetsp:Transcript_42886/g.98384  ORF Transcript_42886/g.98384 Transcript_42886/m.98384 type:complete len:216 (+) Transcript_42886:1176-1823(+)
MDTSCSHVNGRRVGHKPAMHRQSCKAGAYRGFHRKHCVCASIALVILQFIQQSTLRLANQINPVLQQRTPLIQHGWTVLEMYEPIALHLRVFITLAWRYYSCVRPYSPHWVGVENGPVHVIKVDVDQGNHLVQGLLHALHSGGAHQVLRAVGWSTLTALRLPWNHLCHILVKLFPLKLTQDQIPHVDHELTIISVELGWFRAVEGTHGTNATSLR